MVKNANTEINKEIKKKKRFYEVFASRTLFLLKVYIIHCFAYAFSFLNFYL